MIKTEQDELTNSSFTRLTHKKIFRKRSNASSPFSDKSDSSLKHFKFVRLDKNLHTSSIRQFQTTRQSEEPRMSEQLKPINLQQNPLIEKVKLSVCTYQSVLVPKKRIIQGQPLDSQQKVNMNIEKPLTERMNNCKNLPKDFQRIQLLTKQLQSKTKQCKLLENDKIKLEKANNELLKRKQCLQEENQTLKSYVTNLKKRIESEQNMLKQITNLDQTSVQQLHTIQTRRQAYLQKQLKQLRNVVHQNKGNNQKLLQIQLDSYKRQIYQANKTIEALQVNNNCLQIKLKQRQKSNRQIVGGQDSVKLKCLNKKLHSQIQMMKKEYIALRKQYDKILDKRLFTEDSFSLQYSNIG